MWRWRSVQVAVPAAVVNAGLKYMQKRIKLAFMRRLTHVLHEKYTDHRAYYAASTLGGERCVWGGGGEGGSNSDGRISVESPLGPCLCANG